MADGESSCARGVTASPCEAMDSVALRGHLRPPRRHVSGSIRATRAAVRRSRQTALRDACRAAHEHRPGRTEEGEMERTPCGQDRTYPSPHPAPDGGAWL